MAMENTYLYVPIVKHTKNYEQNTISNGKIHGINGPFPWLLNKLPEGNTRADWVPKGKSWDVSATQKPLMPKPHPYSSVFSETSLAGSHPS